MKSFQLRPRLRCRQPVQLKPGTMWFPGLFSNLAGDAAQTFREGLLLARLPLMRCSTLSSPSLVPTDRRCDNSLRNYVNEMNSSAKRSHPVFQSICLCASQRIQPQDAARHQRHQAATQRQECAWLRIGMAGPRLSITSWFPSALMKSTRSMNRWLAFHVAHSMKIAKPDKDWRGLSK